MANQSISGQFITDPNNVVRFKIQPTLKRTQWIGFDDKEKLIYAISFGSDNFQLWKFNFIMKTYKLVKRVTNNLNASQNRSDFCFTEHRDFIGAFQLHHVCHAGYYGVTSHCQPPWGCFIFTFDTIYLKDGSVKQYTIIDKPAAVDVKKNFAHPSSLQLLHLKKDGAWIVKLNEQFYRLNLNEEKRTATLELYASATYNGLAYVNKDSLALFRKSDRGGRDITQMSVLIDATKDQWRDLQLRMLSAPFDAEHVRWKISVSNGSIFALSKHGRTLHMVKLDSDNRWSERKQIFNNYINVDATFDLFFVTDKWFACLVPYDRYLNRMLIILPNNVSSLQDLCMLKMIEMNAETFKDSNETDIREKFNLPVALASKYFGPTWMWS
jgi:hypothetical protein